MNSLTDALTLIPQDKDLMASWHGLLATINYTKQDLNVDNQSSEIFEMFCKKVCKRRCVTFLAVDQLNPRSEEQSSVIRQMLRRFDKVPVKQGVTKLNVKPTDKCFKCGEQGHWAIQCKQNVPHDPAWLEKQQCYTCGQTGHLKKDCKSFVTNMPGSKCTKHNSKSKVRNPYNSDHIITFIHYM